MSRSDAFLCVNGFLTTEMDARAISSALELGLIDALHGQSGAALADLSARLGINSVGLGLLVDLLEVNKVVARTADRVALTSEFEAALQYRN